MTIDLKFFGVAEQDSKMIKDLCDSLPVLTDHVLLVQLDSKRSTMEQCPQMVGNRQIISVESWGMMHLIIL